MDTPDTERALREPVDRIGFLVVELEPLALSHMELQADQKYDQPNDKCHFPHLTAPGWESTSGRSHRR